MSLPTIAGRSRVQSNRTLADQRNTLSPDMQPTDTTPARRRLTIQPGGLALGSILGSVVLPEHVTRHATKCAREFFDVVEANGFPDPVETTQIPLWAERYGAPWIPDVSALGYRRVGKREEIVATVGVDPHTDGTGLVLMVVLHNDGLTFSHGKVRHKPKAGDWFIFDDRKPHAVKEATGRSSFIGWNIPIVEA